MKCTEVKIPSEYKILLPERSRTQSKITENILVSSLYIFLISAIALISIIH